MFILPASPGMQPQGACADIFKLAQSSTMAFEFPDCVASVGSAAGALGGFGVWRPGQPGGARWPWAASHGLPQGRPSAGRVEEPSSCWQRSAVTWAAARFPWARGAGAAPGTRARGSCCGTHRSPQRAETLVGALVQAAAPGPLEPCLACVVPLLSSRPRGAARCGHARALRLRWDGALLCRRNPFLG